MFCAKNQVNLVDWRPGQYVGLSLTGEPRDALLSQTQLFPEMMKGETSVFPKVETEASIFAV